MQTQMTQSIPNYLIGIVKLSMKWNAPLQRTNFVTPRLWHLLVVVLSIVSLIVYGRRMAATFIDSIQIVQPQRGIHVICNASDRILCNLFTSSMRKKRHSLAMRITCFKRD